MALKPGESTVITLEYLMHGDMGGRHDFRLRLLTNDKTQPEQEVQILSNWVP
jgi:hypothetical protein